MMLKMSDVPNARISCVGFDVPKARISFLNVIQTKILLAPSSSFSCQHRVSNEEEERGGVEPGTSKHNWKYMGII